MTQVESNPFQFSDTNKRYYTYDYYLRKTFGEKVAKLPINGGFTCPNIDGKCGVGGCIYCSSKGSGDFAPDFHLSIANQIAEQKKAYLSKWQTNKFIVYFQANTGTYAPLSELKAKYEAALAQEGIVGLNIATRADCLEDDTLEYLAELAKRTVLTLELGLQTSNDQTAKIVNRGHDFAAFCKGIDRIRKASDKIRVGVHIIFGLPNEGHGEMMQTVKDVASLHPDEVKIHLLHVLKGTELAALWQNGDYVPMEREDYIQTVADALEILPKDIVVGRLTGDGAADDLLAPLWSRKKTTVINDIDKTLFARNSMQGEFAN